MGRPWWHGQEGGGGGGVEGEGKGAIVLVKATLRRPLVVERLRVASPPMARILANSATEAATLAARYWVSMTRALVHGPQVEVHLHRPGVHQGSPRGLKRLEVILLEQAGTQATTQPSPLKSFKI